MRYTVAAALVVVASSAAVAAFALKPKPELPPGAISAERARDIALKHTPGTIEAEELEREGDRLIYSYDVRVADGTLSEVEVDALTGDVLSDGTDVEDPDDPEDDDEPEDPGPSR